MNTKSTNPGHEWYMQSSTAREGVISKTILSHYIQSAWICW